MKPYLSILKIRSLVLLQYRISTIASMLTQIFWGFLKVMILTAFYASSTSQQPMSLPQVITFIWLGQAFLRLLPWRIEHDILAQIRSGNIIYELARPLDVYWIWFFRSVATRIVPMLLQSIPLFILAILFFGLSLPVSVSSGLFFVCSLVLASFLSAAISSFVIVTLFWTIASDGIQRMLPYVTLFFSGMVVPLPLFPSWAQFFLEIQPFRCIIDIPCRLYTGMISSGEAIYYLGFQFLWLLTFVVVGKLLMSIIIKRFIVQGG